MSTLLFDALILAIVVLFAVLGVKRGFIKTFFGLFGFLIAIVLSLLFAPALAAFLREHLIEPALSSFFLKRLSEETMQNASDVDFAVLPEGAVALFSRFGVSAEELAGHLVSAGKTAGLELARSLAAFAVARAAETLSSAVAFFSIFAVSSFAIAVLTRALDVVAKVPGLHLSNRVFGFLAGLGEGIALAFVVSRVIALLEPSIRGSGVAWLSDFSVENTTVIRFLTAWSLSSTPKT